MGDNLHLFNYFILFVYLCNNKKLYKNSLARIFYINNFTRFEKLNKMKTYIFTDYNLKSIKITKDSYLNQ